VTETEFLDRWRKESPAYTAWGKFVAQKLCVALGQSVSPVSLEAFLKLPVKPRTKEDDSLLQKAFYRNKSYRDPYTEIEDKVGLRFVVLLASDVQRIQETILRIDDWIAEKARDYVEEQLARPYEFDYQSVHYVLRSRILFTFEETEIPADLPCEVQVRTLLQHAYSELTHDTIYKPNVQATPALKRAAAKSMALIEATSDYFTAVNNEIQAAIAKSNGITQILHKCYLEWIGETPSTGPLQSILVDHYSGFVNGDFEMQLREWWAQKSFLEDAITSRRGTQVHYRLSAILLVYFCASRFAAGAKKDSPLADNELGLIYSDLGQALN
jgi:ppGpp synthetase/RelA/SpoT-type nucleotidyltranferase